MGKRTAPKSWTELLGYVACGHRARVDSRQIKAGDVFVALPGSKSHGGSFADQALKHGAAVVLASRGSVPDSLPQDKVIFHSRPRYALGALAEAHFSTSSLGLTLIGITGTNGKTTVAFLLESLFRRLGHKVGVIGTIVNRWPGYEQASKLTTPGCWDLHRSLFQMAAAGVDTVCMEVSSHALDQQRTAGLGFDAVVLTNVSQDHLDYHQDMQAYFEAKSRLFAEGSLRQDGRRIINADDEYGGLLLSEYPQAWRYGFQPTGGPSQRTLGARLEREDSKGVSLRCEVGGQHWSLTSPLVGRHNAANILAAQATALSLGISPADLKGLEQAQPVPGRLERVPNDQGLDIFVDYAHTPDALENVLQALRRLSPKRLIVVFGCGGDRDRGKRKLMGQAAARLADVVVLTSDNPRHERPEVIMAEVRPGLAACPRVLEHKGRKEAIAAAIELMTPADVLVVAGKGHETYQQIGDDYLEFSDVQVICEQLSCT